MSYSIHLPSYSIGADVYDEIEQVCSPYGEKAVVVGGHKAMAAAKEKLEEGIKHSTISIVDYVWFGGECSFENVERLKSQPQVQEADMIFAVGGGKATDTAKLLGHDMHLPVFSFPTIASNCSACTSVSIMYHPDGRFLQPYFFEKPPVHAFINTQIIAQSPVCYLWAGMGDTYAKYFESEISSRDEEVPHYIAQGVANARMCYEPILKYGKKALQDQANEIVSKELEQVILAVIVSTAIASILLCTDHVIDYNTGLAHAIFYALTSYPVIEEKHLHGEVVAYGVLALLLVDQNEEDFEKVYALHREIDLPLRLEDMDIDSSELENVARLASEMKDIVHNPYPITKEKILGALQKLENMA